MDRKWRAWAKKILSLDRQEFDATLVYEDEKFFIMDWRDKNGSGNLSTRYIVDKKKGDLIIKGDAGDCIASWFNPVSVENLVYYINDTEYFIEKMQCTTNKYTYHWEDVKKDLEDEKQEYLKMLREGDIPYMTEEELEQFQEDLDAEYVSDYFNTLFPAVGTDYAGGYLGFDQYEGDYFGLEPYEYSYAEDEAAKKIMALTKRQILEAVGQCLKIAYQYMAIRYRFDCLSASIEILRGENMDRIKIIKGIEEQYLVAEKSSDGFKWKHDKEVAKLDNMLRKVPQEYWMQ